METIFSLLFGLFTLLVIFGILIGGTIFLIKVMSSERKNKVEVENLYANLVAQTKAKNILIGPFIALDRRGFGAHKSNRLLVLYADSNNLHLHYSAIAKTGIEEIVLPISKLVIRPQSKIVRWPILHLEINDTVIGFYNLHSFTQDATKFKSSTYTTTGTDSNGAEEQVKNFLLEHGAQNN